MTSVYTREGLEFAMEEQQVRSVQLPLPPRFQEERQCRFPKLRRTSGIAFTSLRSGYYTASALMMIGDAIKTGKSITPEEGPVAWTAHFDLAEAAATIISEQNLHGMPPNLTGSESVDMEGIATIASEVLGQTIRRIVGRRVLGPRCIETCRKRA